MQSRAECWNNAVFGQFLMLMTEWSDWAPCGAAPVAIPNVFSEAAYHTAERAEESAAFAEQNLADFSIAF